MQIKYFVLVLSIFAFSISRAKNSLKGYIPTPAPFHASYEDPADEGISVEQIESDYLSYNEKGKSKADENLQKIEGVNYELFAEYLSVRLVKIYYNLRLLQKYYENKDSTKNHALLQKINKKLEFLQGILSQFRRDNMSKFSKWLEQAEIGGCKCDFPPNFQVDLEEFSQINILFSILSKKNDKCSYDFDLIEEYMKDKKNTKRCKPMMKEIIGSFDGVFDDFANTLNGANKIEASKFNRTGVLGECGLADVMKYGEKALGSQNIGQTSIIMGDQSLDKPCTLITLILNVKPAKKNEETHEIVLLRYRGPRKNNGKSESITIEPLNNDKKLQLASIVKFWRDQQRDQQSDSVLTESVAPSHINKAVPVRKAR